MEIDYYNMRCAQGVSPTVDWVRVIRRCSSAGFSAVVSDTATADGQTTRRAIGRVSVKKMFRADAVFVRFAAFLPYPPTSEVPEIRGRRVNLNDGIGRKLATSGLRDCCAPSGLGCHFLKFPICRGHRDTII